MEGKKHIPYSASGDKEEDEGQLAIFGSMLSLQSTALTWVHSAPSYAPKKQKYDRFVVKRGVVRIIGVLAIAVGTVAQCTAARLGSPREALTGNMLPNIPKYAQLDDMEDNSVLRKGIPVAHNIYGLPSVLNATGYAITIALEKVIALNHPEGTQIFLEELLELHRGQGMEIYWRDNCICPSETAYKQTAIRKCGGLLNLAVRLMQLYSNRKEDFTSVTEILGHYIQVLDDYCDSFLQEDTENKSFCEDLSEGTFSFPIVHAIQSHPEDRQLMNMLRQRTKDIHVKRYCINLLEKFGSLAYTERVLEELDKQARNEIERLGGNPLLMKVLDEILLSSQDKKNATMLKTKTES